MGSRLNLSALQNRQKELWIGDKVTIQVKQDLYMSRKL